MIVVAAGIPDWYTLIASAENNYRGHLQKTDIDDLHRLSMISEIAWHENTVQRICGDGDGSMLSVTTNRRVIMDRILQQIEATGMDVQIVNFMEGEDSD